MIALMGAAFTSVITAKNESLFPLINGQKANMNARAGVEWAICFASTGTNADGDSAFYFNPTLSFTKQVDPADADAGTFKVSYDYSVSKNLLTVEGVYKNSTEKVTLANFRNYLSYITLVPGKNPTYSGQTLRVPIWINGTVRISKIDLLTNYSSYSYRTLQYIRDPNNDTIFDYYFAFWNAYYYYYFGPEWAWYKPSFPFCNSSYSNAPCHSISGNGLVLRASGVTRLEYPELENSSLSFSEGKYDFQFLNSPTLPTRVHTIGFISDNSKSEIGFHP